MIIEPMRGDYHPFHNLTDYFPPPRLNSGNRLQNQIKEGEGRDDARERWMGGFRAKSGLGSEVGNLDVFLGK